jgi:hypothetical protein
LHALALCAGAVVFLSLQAAFSVNGWHEFLFTNFIAADVMLDD